MVSNMKFKEIESHFNNLLEDVEIEDSIDASYVRSQIFEELSKKCVGFNLVDPTINNSEFSFEVKFSKDFNKCKNFIDGKVIMRFKIRTSRTKKLEIINKTKKRYINTKHKNPVKFIYCTVKSKVDSFDWEDIENPSNLNITTKGKELYTPENIEGNAVSEVIASVTEGLPQEFQRRVIQPILKSIVHSAFGEKTVRMKEIENILDSDTRTSIEKKEWTIIKNSTFEKSVLDNNLLVF